ncbi:MAG: calcium-binding protein, partial [Betaproteobacteria bacterium]|nr:calcium-binding protein [Betaproteobacteria bacterium]
PQPITGTAANETLLGGFGNDSILGLAGNDSIDGQAGSDTIDGGDGNDTLIGNYGDDSLLGGAGDDQLSDDQGSNVLDGGDGRDRLETRSLAGNHTLRGGTGNDFLIATGKTLNLDGGDGNDELNVNGYLLGTYVNAGVATLSGGGGDDDIRISYFSQATLDGGLGNDYLYADESRNLSMAGGAGEDSLYLRYNNYYSDYTDTSRQKPESYVLDGGADNDVLTAVGYSNSYDGQVFITIRGGSGDDSLTLIDIIAGKQSTGTANSGVSAALLEGGDGNDSLWALGALQVTLTGGTGVDRFMLTAQQWYTLKAGNLSVNTESGYVTVQAKPVEITDFVVGSAGDVLDYSDLLRNASLTYNGSNPFSSGFLKLTQQGADTLLQFDEDGSAANAASLTTLAILKNVQATQLIAANFNPNFNPNFPPDGLAVAPQPITGTAANETLLGGFGNDSILGLAGNDSID